MNLALDGAAAASKPKKKKSKSGVIFVIILIVGLALLLYPNLSNYWNQLHQSRAVSDYVSAVSEIDEDTKQRLLQSAYEYNRRLFETSYSLTLSKEQEEEYFKQLDITGTGVMGYIEVPKIDCFLPIYHTTEESVLQIAVGHITGSSLPVGGENTHALLSGHRGLPSARLFTDLDKLQEGDSFSIRVLDEVVTYEVDQIRTVLPTEIDDLSIVAGGDYCTLITCTPYGINTHRLLVRGHRVQNGERTTIRVTGDAVRINPLIVAPVMALPVLLILLLILLFKPVKKTV